MRGSMRELMAVPLLFVLACSKGPGAGSAPPSQAAVATAAPAAASPKRLTISVVSEPTGFNLAVETQRISVVQAGLAYLLFPGLTVWDEHTALRPTLGAAVPSVDNGLWTVNPDGTMQTTYPIRQGAMWHDGSPLTGDDLAFTLDVVRDPELAEFHQLGTDLIARVTPNADSVLITWKQPYVDADALFSMTGNGSHSNPLPKHLLEQDFLTNKAGLTQLRYWTDDFVGIGAYRIKEWAHGSHLLLAAFDGYALGRPKIDEIDVR